MGRWTFCALLVCSCALPPAPGTQYRPAGGDVPPAPDVATPPDAVTCASPQVRCGADCADTRVSLVHCGACGNACASGQSCVAGVCTGGGASLTQRSCATAGTPGCGMVPITGGNFILGSNIDCGSMGSNPGCVYGGSPEQPNVTVADFAIDAYEVTVARFNAYWDVRARDMATVRGSPIPYPHEAIMWQPPPNAEPLRQDTYCNWLPDPSSRDAHPMNCVDYWMAQEFCVWDGGHLPTEAQWEFVARGGARAGLAAGRLYAWGDDPPSASCDRAQWNGCPGEDGARTRRVGRFSTGAAGGVFDLTGNVWEWVADNYAAYSGMGSASPCGNRTGTSRRVCNNSATGDRVFRGGSWHGDDAAYLRAASRFYYTPANRDGSVGFRCARDTP